MYKKLRKDLFRIKLGRHSSHCYLITSDINALIDTGSYQDFSILSSDLNEIGLDVKDIGIVINTHEHFDHIGGNIYLQKNSIVATNRFAAVKIIYGDDEVTMCRANKQDVTGYNVHIWLGNTDVIHIGNWFLKIFHTPGHTSGCLSIYETKKRILFSGDALFSDGTLSTILKSGSLGEYLNSIRRLSTMKIDLLLPGHGRESNDAEKDIEKTIKNASNRFADTEYLSALFE